MSALRPMDPERLAKLRDFIDPASVEAELLADRDLGWATAQKNRGEYTELAESLAPGENWSHERLCTWTKREGRGRRQAGDLAAYKLEEARAEAERVWSTSTERLTPGMMAEYTRLDILWQQLVRERDEFRRQAIMYRDRCLVEARDVKAAGVTLPGHARPWMKREQRREPDCVNVGASSIAAYINAVAKAVGRPAFDILDEMASMAQEQS